jgi:outer membrane lipoprotein-sorting protein
MKQRRKIAIGRLNLFIMAVIPILVLVETASPASLDTTAIKNKPFVVMSMMENAYQKVNDYTAVFHKRNMRDGKVTPEENIYIKYKKPFKLYMKWLNGPHEGREAIYIKGMNNNEMVGHECGVLGLFDWNLDPKCETAMKEQRHPLTDMGVGRLVEIISGDAKRAAAAKQLRLVYLGEEKVYGNKVWHIRMDLPPIKDYYSPKSEGWIDEESHLPLKVILYDPKGEFIESFGYSDLKLNPGLSDAEFEKGYKDYDF